MADHGAALADYSCACVGPCPGPQVPAGAGSGAVGGAHGRAAGAAGRRARGSASGLTRERNWIDLHRSELIQAGCRRDLSQAEEAAEAAREGVTRTRAALAAAEIMDIIAEIGTLDAQIAEHDAPLTEARAKLAGIGGKARALLLAAGRDLPKPQSGPGRRSPACTRPPKRWRGARPRPGSATPRRSRGNARHPIRWAGTGTNWTGSSGPVTWNPAPTPPRASIPPPPRSTGKRRRKRRWRNGAPLSTSPGCARKMPWARPNGGWARRGTALRRWRGSWRPSQTRLLAPAISLR